MSRMDVKLDNIRKGRYRRSDFMIADAKDADMGSGVCCGGPTFDADGSRTGFRTRRAFLDQIKAIVEQDIVDIMLVSASNLERLQAERVFAGSDVQTAIRANETTDIWAGLRGGHYARQRSRPHRSASIPRLTGARPNAGTDLGLYSMTFNNDLDDDLRTLEEFCAFREEASLHGFRYFLEVFHPNAPVGLEPADIPRFMNDHIVRCLAGVMEADRPLFLKIPFNGPEAMEELAGYDDSLIVGVLGGGAGTARDTFELLVQSERHGGRLALFGRKINLAESPLSMVTLMRQVVDGTVSPAEAVRAYHGELQRQSLRPFRSLEDDSQVTEAPLKRGA